MITQTRLKELLHYNPESGVFTWVNPPNKWRRKVEKVGDVVGSLSSGYLLFCFEGEVYKLHRLAFLYMEGKLPQGEVDHINEIKSDNRWCNLRACSQTENGRNRGKRSDNSSGVKGISLEDVVGKRPRIKGRVTYSEFAPISGGLWTWKKQILRFSRSFDRGDEASKQKALAEVTEWVRATREKHHGEFCNHG